MRSIWVVVYHPDIPPSKPTWFYTGDCLILKPYPFFEELEELKKYFFHYPPPITKDRIFFAKRFSPDAAASLHDDRQDIHHLLYVEGDGSTG